MVVDFSGARRSPGGIEKGPLFVGDITARLQTLTRRVAVLPRPRVRKNRKTGPPKSYGAELRGWFCPEVLALELPRAYALLFLVALSFGRWV
jgi:hypothetical protein